MLWAARQRGVVILKDRQIGGLASVSISDNSSSNVIIGSLIKINLISATHNTLTAEKISASLTPQPGEQQEAVEVGRWTGTGTC